MNSIHWSVLAACSEAVGHQRKLLSLMADHLNLQRSQILYEWTSGKLNQRGDLSNGEWSYFFNGMECDFKNSIDGRLLRVDFGPQGRTDAFTRSGILQFILCSKPPWSEFKELKRYFTKESTPYDHVKRYFTKASSPYHQKSGSDGKMDLIWSELEQEGFIEKADQSLIDFATKYTFTDKDGSARTEFPRGTAYAKVVDCAVAGRNKLSGLAKLQLVYRTNQVLSQHQESPPKIAEQVPRLS